MDLKIFKPNYLFTCVAVLLFLGYAFILFYKLGSHPMVDWDEGIYSQVARQSFQTHSIADLHYYGSVSPGNPAGLWFEKPPLMIWLIESAYMVFGVTEFAARFWNALFALGIVALSYFYAIKLFKTRAVGLLSLALFYLANFFISQAYYLKFDIPVTFFILLACYSFSFAKDDKKYWLLFWASIGLGVLTKSVIGLIPLLPVLADSAIAGDWLFLRNNYFYYGILLCALIVVPWHLIETLRYGGAFWQIYLGFHVLSRYVHTLDNHSGSFWYYVQQMKGNLIFDGLSVIGLAYFFIKSWTDKSSQRPYLFLISSVVLIFLLFSLAATKLASYIVPMYPFLIIIIAKTLYDFFSSSKFLFLEISGMALLSAFFVALGFIFNSSKLNDNGYYSHYYYENKAFIQYADRNFPGLNIFAQDRDLPSLIFYADKEVYSWPPSAKIAGASFILITDKQPTYAHTTMLAQGSTGAMFLVTAP